MLPQFSYSSAEVRRVRQVQFGVLSPEEIKAMSVVEITKPLTYTAGLPVRHGLNDPRLGTCDLRATCETCMNTYAGSKINDCPGHFGHIELASPVWHVGFLPVVYKIIQCLCINCGRLLADRNSAEYKRVAAIPSGKKRLLALLKLCRSRRQCRGNTPVGGAGAGMATDGGDVDGSGGLSAADVGCNAHQPIYRRDGLRITMEFKEENVADMGLADRKQVLSPERAHALLSSIRDEDVIRVLGLDPRYSRPEWLVLTVLPVAPPHVRPSVALDSLARADDDITHKYGDIVKTNTVVAMSKRAGQPPVIIADMEAALQWHVATLVNSALPNLPGAKQTTGKALKTFRDRLVGKGGRVRGNLMGKRVDFSARTVITADPNLSIHQVGVPRSIASNLTVPERVNRYNIRRLQELVARGPDEHPGARFIVRDNGVRIDLRYGTSAHDRLLKYGYVVERHLSDDDTVLFNRQPTLHKMSIMCHKVKVLDYSTFRMNLTCTTPYNADFDGDEMNMHALQTLPAIAEASELMVVPRLLITAQANRPVMGIVQDTLLGSRIFTYRDVFVPKDVLMCAIMWMSGWDGRIPQPAIMKPTPGKPGRFTPLWTGKQIFSMIMPEVNYECDSQRVQPGDWKSLWPTDGRVLIQKGQLLTGMLDKASLGNKGNSLLHVIMNDLSPEDCRDFINNTQRTVNYWLLHRGFSIGIGDSESTADTMRGVVRAIEEAKTRVAELLQRAQQLRGVERQPGQSMEQYLETLITGILGKARDNVSKAVVDTLDERGNAVLTMVAAGSKGSDLNIAQIIGCVAQQVVEGKRIPFGFRSRTLPHFAKFDIVPRARGFVENSYLKGLTPSEFFFHMMGGREGLIDTAVKTAETGYIQRRLVKAMEDLMVRYDGTVRNSCNEVLQFLYGEDGMDGRWIENNHFPAYKPSIGALRSKFEWALDEPDFARAGAGREVFIEPSVLDDMRHNMDTREALAREFEAISADRRTTLRAMAVQNSVEKDSTPMPLAVARMIANAKTKFRIAPSGVSDLHPVRDVIEPVAALLSRLVVVPGRDQLSREAQANGTASLQVLLRSQLASKPVMQAHRLTREAFAWLLGEVETRFNISIVAAGEMCGVLAAQSLGEPATQMTLNTFHSAGAGVKNATTGMPRLKELINVAKKIRTPSLTIFVKEHLRRDAAAALQTLQPLIESITLDDLVEESRILYDPDPTTSVMEEDKTFVEINALAPDEGVNLEALSPWVLRLRLSRELMAARVVTLGELKAKIKDTDGTLDVIFNDENAPVPVIRIRTTAATRLAAAAEGEDADAAAAREAAGSTGDEDERTLRDLEAYLLEELPLRGIRGVKKIFKSDHKRFPWTPEGGVGAPVIEPRFDTEGSALQAVLNLPEVDHTRTITNDTIEVLEVLGIEACRLSLLNEMRGVMSEGGNYVNYRHLALLVDTMTFRGYLTAVTRHGINRTDTGPLIRASFEETCEILMEAAAYGETDEMQGASDNVMLGQLCPIGTNHCDVLLDEDRLREAIPVDYMSGELLSSGAGMGGMGGMGGAGGGFAYVGATPLLASPDIGGLGGGSSPYSGSVYGSGMSPGGPQFSPSSFTPQAALTPAFSPAGGLGAMSPGAMSPSAYAMAYSPAPSSPSYGGGLGAGGGYVPQSPAFTPQADGGAEYSPTSAALGMTPMSVGGGGSGLPHGMSPGGGSGFYASSGGGSSYYSGGASGSGSGFSPSSPQYGSGGMSAGMSPASPAYSPTNVPSSPSYGAGAGAGAGARYGAGVRRGASGAGAGGAGAGGGMQYSPSSPAFSDGGLTPASSGGAMQYSPSAGPGAGGGAHYSPSAPVNVSSPAYSPNSPAFSPQSPAYSPSAAAGGSSSGAPAGSGSGSGGAGFSPSSWAGAGSGPAAGSEAYSPSAAPGSGSGGAGFSPSSPGMSPTSPRLQQQGHGHGR